MNWKPLTEESQLPELLQESFEKPVVVFKHSTRCPISSMAKTRLETATPPANIPFYFLDLIAYRSLSNAVASTFKVHHESPQVIVLRNGEATFDESHNGIRMEDIAEAVA